jgi:hypothetical protein
MNYNILGGFDNFLGGLIVGSDESDSDNKSNHSDKSNVSSYLDSQQSDNESNHSKHSRHSPKSNHSRHSPKSNHSEEELFESVYTKENNSDNKNDDLLLYINSDSKHGNERKDNLTIEEDKKHKKNKPKNINTSPKSPHSMGSAFSSPNTPIKHSEPNTPIKHSIPNSPIKHPTPNSPINNSTLNSPINNSTPNTPSSDKSTVAKSPKHKNKKHKNKKHKTKKHENKSPLHSTVDSDTEPPSKSEFVDEEPSMEKLEKMIEKESNPTEPLEPIKDQSDFITPEDGELPIFNLNKNANTEEPLDSDKLIFKGSSEDSPFAVLGGYINSTFST